MVLKKTLESPLDCKEIKPVNAKGNQSWIFIGRTDAEDPIVWPPDSKSRLTGKDHNAGKYWRQKEKRVAEDEIVRQHHQLTGHEFEQTPGDNERQRSPVCCSPCVVKNQTRIRSHLRRRPVSHWNSRGSLMGHATFQKTDFPIHSR